MARNRQNTQTSPKPTEKDETDLTQDQAPQAPADDADAPVAPTPADDAQTPQDAPQAPADDDSDDNAQTPPSDDDSDDDAPQAPSDAEQLASAVAAAVDAFDRDSATFPTAPLEQVRTALKRFSAGAKRERALSDAVSAVQDAADAADDLPRIRAAAKLTAAYRAHASTTRGATAPAPVDPLALALQRCQALQAAHAAVLAALSDDDAARVVADLSEPTSADAVTALGIAPTPSDPEQVTEQAWRPIVRGLVGRGPASAKRTSTSGERKASGTIPSIVHAIVASDDTRSWTNAQIAAAPTNVTNADGTPYTMSAGAVKNAMVALVRQGVLTCTAAPAGVDGFGADKRNAPAGTPIGTYAVRHADHGAVDADQ